MQRLSRKSARASVPEDSEGLGMYNNGLPTAHVRFKLGLVELDDVAQTFRPDVNVFLYYKPSREVLRAAEKHAPTALSSRRFVNIERPAWVPHLDFNNEVAEPIVTDESFWLDTLDGVIFARLNVLPLIQERLDHAHFPFDRQIADLQLMSNNCQLAPWERTEKGTFPVETSMARASWLVQCELAAMADAWDLHDIQVQIVNDAEANSSLAHFQIFIERSSGFYQWNLLLVYFLIIAAQGCMVIQPYNESRLDFALGLALTSVAFLFVSQQMVPKTSYLTVLDKYFIAGLSLLALRFFSDTVMQLSLQIPVGEEGYRGTCEDLPSDELSICTADAIITAALTGSWFVISAVFVPLGTLIFRPSWGALTNILRATVKEGHSSNHTDYEIKGKSHVLLQTRALSYADLENAVDVEASNRELQASLSAVQDDEDKTA